MFRRKTPVPSFVLSRNCSHHFTHAHVQKKGAQMQTTTTTSTYGRRLWTRGWLFVFTYFGKILLPENLERSDERKEATFRRRRHHHHRRKKKGKRTSAFTFVFHHVVDLHVTQHLHFRHFQGPKREGGGGAWEGKWGCRPGCGKWKPLFILLLRQQPEAVRDDVVMLPQEQCSSFALLGWHVNKTTFSPRTIGSSAGN